MFIQRRKIPFTCKNVGLYIKNNFKVLNVLDHVDKSHNPTNPFIPVMQGKLISETSLVF